MAPKIEIYKNDELINDLKYLLDKDQLSKELNLQVWNNRYGDEEVEDLDEPAMTFSDNEGGINSKVLNCFEIEVDGVYHVLDEIKIGEYLSGSPNDGEIKEENEDNFIEIKVRVNVPKSIVPGTRNLSLHIGPYSQISSS